MSIAEQVRAEQSSEREQCHDGPWSQRFMQSNVAQGEVKWSVAFFLVPNASTGM